MNSQQWWNNTKNNPSAFAAWLVDQLHGERLAATRLQELSETIDAEPRVKRGFSIIAKQEAQHADWVEGLLRARGVADVQRTKQDRYWGATLPEDFKALPVESLAAIGAHAEAMRLDRIRAIASDEEAPEDVREVFQKILKDELFHERFFREVAGPEAMAAAHANHETGRALLGLTA